jgi:hypothetical protein
MTIETRAADAVCEGVCALGAAGGWTFAGAVVVVAGGTVCAGGFCGGVWVCAQAVEAIARVRAVRASRTRVLMMVPPGAFVFPDCSPTSNRVA